MCHKRVANILFSERPKQLKSVSAETASKESLKKLREIGILLPIFFGNSLGVFFNQNLNGIDGIWLISFEILLMEIGIFITF